MLLPAIITLATVAMIRCLEALKYRMLKRIFNVIPSILLAYIIPAIVCGILGLDFSESHIHHWSRNLLIPLAIITVMSSLPVQQLKIVGWRPILLFVIGSAWIALFPVLTLGLNQLLGMEWKLFDDPGYWLGIPPIVGSWIGGSTSQLVLKELAECPENIFLNVLLLDALLVNVWTLIMFQAIQKSERINRLLGIRDSKTPASGYIKNLKSGGAFGTVSLIVIALLLNHFMPSTFVVQVVVLSAIGLVMGNFVKFWNHTLALKIGGVLILMVMSILGLRLRLESLEADMVFVVFLIIWLLSHFFIMLAFARWLNLHSAWVPIASMANVGGIATAPAVTAAYKPEWMPHAVLLAILSMATGTFWGILTLGLLNWIGI